MAMPWLLPAAAMSTDDECRYDCLLLSSAAVDLCGPCAVGCDPGRAAARSHDPRVVTPTSLLCRSWTIPLNDGSRTGHHALVTAISMPLVMPVPEVAAVPEIAAAPDVHEVREVPEAQDDAGEGDLVERLRAGERAAVEAAYLAHHAAIRSFARRLVGDAASAEDIVHEAFVALPRAIRRFRGEGSLRAFLIGVAANHSRRHVRSAMRRRRATERLAAREELEPRTIDATAALITRELANRLWAALDELPIDQRVVFVLCEAEQRTSVEVAGIVGAPEGTVRTRLFHAKRKLRAMLGETP
jgi:RNA polymerase sigma-70 factor (ECF subfamily)